MSEEKPCPHCQPCPTGRCSPSAPCVCEPDPVEMTLIDMDEREAFKSYCDGNRAPWVESRLAKAAYRLLLASAPAPVDPRVRTKENSCAECLRMAQVDSNWTKEGHSEIWHASGLVGQNGTRCSTPAPVEKETVCGIDEPCHCPMFGLPDHTPAPVESKPCAHHARLYPCGKEGCAECVVVPLPKEESK